MADAKCVYYMLAESVAARLREHGFRARCVGICTRTTDLLVSGCQMTLNQPTDLTSEIADAAYRLFAANFAGSLPLRSVGIACTQLSPADTPMQVSFADDPAARIRRERLDQTIDDLRRRYGHNIVQRGVVLTDPSFAALKPKEDHTIHPVPFWAG